MKDRVIAVTGKGKVSARPDTTVLSLSISELRKDYGEALQLSAGYTQKLRECVKAAGLDPDELKTQRFNIQPEYNTEYNVERESLLKKTTRSEQVLAGYRFRHDLKLKFPIDNERLGAVLGELLRANIGVRFDFSYTVNDPEPLRIRLLEEAARVSRANAQALATASGAELGEVIEINYAWDRLDVYEHPVEMMYACEAAPTGALDIDISPDDIDLEEEITITWALK